MTQHPQQREISRQELFRAVLEQAPDAMIFADRNGMVALWNRAAESLFGYSAAEMAGKSLDVIIPEHLRAAHRAGFRNAIETGHEKYAGRVLTTRSVHRDGHKLYVDLSFALVRDAGGAVTGALATARDCTERYLSDRALRARISELEQRLQEKNDAAAAAPGTERDIGRR